MGETHDSYTPKENEEKKFTNNDNANADVEMPSENEDSDMDDTTPEEFEVLNSQLDALNSALDDIEQKNDNIHAQLLLLLEENREIRRQMKESVSVDGKQSNLQSDEGNK